MAGRKEYELLFKLQAQLGNNFKTSFTDAMSVTKKLQGSISQMNSVAGKVEGFKRQTQAVEASKKKLADLTAEQARLEQEMSRSEAPSEKLTQAYKRNQAQIERTTAKIKTQEAALDKMGAELKQAGINTEDLTAESKRLSAALDKARASQKKMADIAEDQRKVRESIKQTRAELLKLTAAATAAGVAFYKAFITPAANFEEQMSTVRAISGASMDDMAKLSTLAKQMGATTKFTAVEAGQAMEYMAMAGWASTDILSGLSGVMNLAAASGEDLAAVSDIVTDAMTAFGLSADKSDHFSDVLAKTASSANTNVGLMGETFKNVAPVAGALGYSIEDMSVAIGLMANSGIKGSKSGTALKNIIANLADPTDDVAQAMKELGVSIKNGDGTAKSFEEVMLSLRAGMDGLSQTQKVAYASTIAGKESFAGLLAVINSSETDFDTLYEKIYNCTGAAEKMAAIRLDNLNGDITIAKSAWEGLSTTVGELFTPSMREGVQSITEFLGKMNQWVQDNPETTKTIVKVAGAVTALAAGGLTAKLGFLHIKSGIDTAKTAAEALKLKFVDLGAGGVNVLQKMKSFGSGIAGYFSNIGGAVGQTKAGAGLFSMAGKLKGVFGNAFAQIGTKAGGAFGTIGKMIADGPLGKIGSVIGGGLGKLGSFLAPAKNVLGAVLSPLGSLPKLLGGGLGGLFGKIMPLIMVVSLLATAFMELSGNGSGEFFEQLKELGAQAIPVLQEIMGQLRDLGQQLMPLIMDTMSALAPLFMQIVSAILPVLLEVLQQIVPIISQVVMAIMPVILQVIQTLAPIFTELITTLLPIFLQLLQALAPVIQLLADMFSNGLAAAMGAVTGILHGITTALQGVIQFVTGVFSGDWKAAWEGVKKIFSGIWEALVNIVKAPINFIIGAINTLIRGLNKLKIPDWVPAIGGKGFNIPEIPLLAKGSRSTPDTFIAGEAGPELITNTPGRTVFTAKETARLMESVSAARQAGTAQVVNMAPLMAAMAAMRAPESVSAPKVESRATGGASYHVEVHSAPTIYTTGDPANLEAQLRAHDEATERRVMERIRQEQEDKERTRYD